MNKITFLISCIVVVASILRWGHVSKKKQHQVAHIQHNQSIPVKYEAGVVALLMLLAIVLRLYQFGSIPGGMNQDGAMAAVDAKALSQYGTDRFGTYMPVHFTAWGYGQMSVFLSYCMVPFIKFFGLSPVTARLPVLIFSMAGLGAIYFIIRSVLGIEAALIALFLAIINPWHFVQSRWALDCNMLPHVFVLAFALLVWGIYKIKKLGVYISMAIFGLCMYCYGVALYTVPVFLFVIALYMIKEKVLTIREVLISAGVFLLISGPFILTMAINTFSWNTMRVGLLRKNHGHLPA